MRRAWVAELVYAADLKSVTRKGVWVRFPPQAKNAYVKRVQKNVDLFFAHLKHLSSIGRAKEIEKTLRSGEVEKVDQAVSAIAAENDSAQESASHVGECRTAFHVAPCDG